MSERAGRQAGTPSVKAGSFNSQGAPPAPNDGGFFKGGGPTAPTRRIECLS